MTIDGSGDQQTELSILHRAASILRNDIDGVKDLKDNCYPSAADVSLKSSLDFVPEILKLFITWLIDLDAFQHASDVGKMKTNRRSLTIAESIIFCSRKILTPLHLGLATYLHHEYGSRNVLDVMNRFGVTVCYDEVRRFLTSCAEEEIRRMEDDSYLASNLIPRNHGGMLIQEGDDNVDIQSGTIDGFNTLHAMARVSIQYQTTSQRTAYQCKSGPEICRNKALDASDLAKAVGKMPHYKPPVVRPEPPRIQDAVSLIKKCITNDASKTVSHIVWVFLRNVCRIERFPIPDCTMIEGQKIPFSAGYNSRISKPSETFSVVAYKPVINAKPSCPKTVHKTMTGCVQTARTAQQNSSVQTVDQQLYAVAQTIKWDRAGEFENHVLRIGGMHTVYPIARPSDEYLVTLVYGTF